MTDYNKSYRKTQDHRLIIDSLQSTFPMSNTYAPIADNDEEEYHLKSNSAPNLANTVSVGRGIMGLLLVLTILNMILAVTNGYYSLHITKLLQQYEEKPLSSLPRIDPFNGQYRPPLAGRSCSHIVVVFLTQFDESRLLKHYDRLHRNLAEQVCQYASSEANLITSYQFSMIP